MFSSTFVLATQYILFQEFVFQVSADLAVII